MYRPGAAPAEKRHERVTATPGAGSTGGGDQPVADEGHPAVQRDGRDAQQGVTTFRAGFGKQEEGCRACATKFMKSSTARAGQEQMQQQQQQGEGSSSSGSRRGEETTLCVCVCVRAPLLGARIGEGFG